LPIERLKISIKKLRVFVLTKLLQKKSARMD